MFTGIVEGIGIVKTINKGRSGYFTLIVEPPFDPMECNIGDSVSIDGVCLTITKMNSTTICMDISTETLSRSTLGLLKIGDIVNIERALRLSSRIGGHIVLGHVDGKGKIVSTRQIEGGLVLKVSVDRDISRYIIEKGSIAVDGISLTVNACGDNFFEVNIIPQTAQQTAILKKRIDLVNIETDILGKYVEKFLNNIKLKFSGVTIETLKKYGFIG